MGSPVHAAVDFIRDDGEEVLFCEGEDADEVLAGKV